MLTTEDALTDQCSVEIRRLGANVRNALVAAANGGTTVLVDIGGDPDGAIALGRYRNIIKETNYQLLYVINQRRYQTSNAAEALDRSH